MSRIGKKPIPLPDKVKVDIQAENIVVTGPKGSVSNRVPPGIRFEKKDKELVAIRQKLETDGCAYKRWSMVCRNMQLNSLEKSRLST